MTGASQVSSRGEVAAPVAGSDPWANWLARLAHGEWRTPVFFEIVSSEISARSGSGRPTVMDVGCGRGFDGERRIQEALATQAGKFIGVEPDPSMDPPKIFTEVFHTLLEDAPIPRGSVDVAYAIMVLEHVADPAAFWSRLYDILVPGGVFVAFTVNGAHWCAPVTRFLSAARLKSAYLTLLFGKPGADRVADYPVYYRTNTPAQIQRAARNFRSVTTLTCGTVGDVASYAPRPLRPMVRAFDQLAHRINGQRCNLIVRAER